MTAVLNSAGPDAGAVWHYGDPLGEQRAAERGEAGMDLSHRPTFRITGPDRLTFLHAITSQDFRAVTPGEHVTAFMLDHTGRILAAFGGIDDGETLWAHTEPGRGEALVAEFNRLRFASKIEVELAPERALVATDAMRIIPREQIPDALAGRVLAGTWAMDALRIAAGHPRIFVDTDEATIPNELFMPDGDRLGMGVHLKKGCYRGQETVGRTFTMGRPPRRLTRLHLDGSTGEIPDVGTPLTASGVVVGRLGQTAIHHELGPIALGLVKRNVPVDTTLDAAGVAASQEVIVDPEVGLHFRPGPLPGEVPGRRLK